ncbi:MAG: hypothetical protein L6R40_003577 [Gallowayella cf. fulva]|nr:MAG: hypothetical protein L6R40_003577 [Xanthomendoza cf. fulva]
MGIFSPSPTNIAVAAGLFIVYVACLYIYRAFFDQLSHIPGPKLAAATLWYEFYYDVVKKGRYTWEIWRMHEKYGPVVRISPYEIHINDPEFIDQVYPGSAVRTEKYPWSQKMFGLKHGFFVTFDHDLHRIRRSAFAHYLSVASLRKLEPGIQSVVDTMVRRLHEVKGTGKVINCLDLFGCLTGDIIGQYAFAESYGFLEDPDFSPHWHKTLMDVSKNSHVLKQFGILMPIMQAMPEWLVKITTPGMMTLLNFQKSSKPKRILPKVRTTNLITHLVLISDEIRSTDTFQGLKPIGQTNIFYDVLTNPTVDAHIKETPYLQDEAQTIIGAGTVTTGHILSLLHFYILDNPSVRAKLQSELGNLMSSTPQPKWAQLEQLPYLSAVITEGLRIGYGVSHRMQRLFPDTVLRHGDIAIPPMTPVSMTSVLIHDNPSLFPSPREFKPERFIDDPALKRYLIPFSRGTRQCAGLNMAYAEFYLGVAAVWAPGRFEWRLWETGRRDVETVHDFVNTSPWLGSRGIRVTVD